MAIVEYQQGTKFPGTIGQTVSESTPAWPQPIRARDGAPSVLFFVLDDVGYRQLSCFGGEGLCVGRDGGTGLAGDYLDTRPCRFTGGTTHRVTVDVSDEPFLDLEREAQAMLTRE
jgi:hypothetical protein